MFWYAPITAWVKRAFEQHWWLMPLFIFLVWRTGIEVIGRIAFDASLVSPWYNNPSPPLWARWDSGWYWSIVNLGYSVRAGTMANVAFFPLYPMVWRVFQSVFGMPSFYAGILVAHLFAIATFFVWFRFVMIKYGTQVACRSLILFSCYPASFFLISVYSESTLIFFVVVCFALAAQKRFGLSSVAAALASAARPVGILLWPSVLVLWIVSHKLRKLRIRNGIPLLLVPSLGLIAFSLFLWLKVGNPFAWFAAQASAGRGFTAPWLLLWAYMHNVATGGEFWMRHLAELAALTLVVFHLPAMWRMEKGYAVYAALSAMPYLLSNTLTSIQRFVLAIVPLFLVLGMKRDRVFFGYIIIFTPLLVFSIFQFVRWQWAG